MAGSDGRAGEVLQSFSAVKVLVPGYGGRTRAVERWRMRIAADTLRRHGGGELIVSGYRGEAERLAALAPAGTEVTLEIAARSTHENIERSLPWLEEAEHIAIATDRFHARRAARHLRAIRPDLGGRLVPPTRRSLTAWLMDVASAGHHALLWLRARGRTDSRDRA